MGENNNSVVVKAPSYPPTTLRKKSLIPLGIIIDVIIKVYRGDFLGTLALARAPRTQETENRKK